MAKQKQTAISVYAASLEECRKTAETSPECVVGYSGGKDSLATLQLAVQAFRRVVCVHLYLIPGLDFVEKRLQFARDRFGVEVVEYPAPALLNAIRYGHYRPAVPKAFIGIQKFTLDMMIRLAGQELGIKTLMIGRRETDFLTRKVAMRGGMLAGENPIREWMKYDVMAYLRRHDLPIPESAGDARGVDLTAESLMWIHDTFPDDWQKLLRYFPFAEAILHRKQLYGE